MTKGSPSMVALLGLLAVAGYQNRDRLSQLMQPHGGNAASGAAGGFAGSGSADQQTNGGLVENLRTMFTGTDGIAGGLSELISRFTKPTQAAKANTWIDTGPNGDLSSGDLEEVLDDETVADLMEKTGLSRADLMTRLAAVLPDAVDQLTPKGRLPTADEARMAY